MSTLVVFHAHPDDEAIATGGTMAKAAAAGHRVVLVVATRGERGEVADGYLKPGEELWQRRVEETHAAADLLGVSRVEFLGYVDSGMMGLPTNDDPECFWQADVEEAAGRLAAILAEEQADVLTAYDENGVYGHPDHIQVNRVGVRAGAIAGTPKVYLQTVNKRPGPAPDVRGGGQRRRPPRRHRCRSRNRRERGPDHHDRRRHRLRRPQAQGDGRPRQPDLGGVVLPGHAPGDVQGGVRPGGLHPLRRAARPIETDVFAGLPERRHPTPLA